ncbi:cell division initiation protein [Streptomyces sp. NPDC004647]|uniref:cell division initiation protein n=1 Tax=Streptomyces sp. NPDC004647 TaxID=3154671 RepID=UPI0033AD4A97
MDVQKKLDEIVETVGSARSMPMSASCVVNRAELLAMLEEVREALPGSLAQAQELLGGRDLMVEEARQEAERIINSAHAQRGSLISDTEVARQSQEEADRIRAEARREAEEIRAEADDYVDSKLANFEVVLTKTLGSVGRGREKLLGLGPGLDEQGYEDEDAPERSVDPGTLRERADSYVDAKIGAFEAVLSKTLAAVGRGRQKLHGQQAADDLGAHMAAQDGAMHAPQTSDADYLAGLAAPQEHPQQPEMPPQLPQQPQQQPEMPVQLPQQPQPQQEYYDPAAVYQQDPYAYQGYVQQDAYGYPLQDPYGYQQPYDPNAGYAPQPPQPPQPPQQQQQHPQQQQQASALDETSLFDTSVIDLDQLRQYEQGR